MIDSRKKYIIRLPTIYQSSAFVNSKIVDISYIKNIIKFETGGKVFLMPLSIIVLEEQDEIDYNLNGEIADE